MTITVEHRNDTVPYHIYEAIQIFPGMIPDIIFIPGSNVTVIKAGNEILNVDESDNNTAKRDIYVFLSKLLNYKSPWGCMTGIRPAKTVHNLQESHVPDEEIIKYLKEYYLLREDKAYLALDTANAQKDFIKEHKSNKNHIGFYSGIPFCPTRCLYCSFTSNPITKYIKTVDTYLDVLEEEIKGTANLIKEQNLIIRSVYLGGGTPTSLSEAQFYRYLSMLAENLDLDNISEFSLEAGRPDSITPDKLKTAKRFGVTRISINPQTMNDKTLKLIGRNHTGEDIRRAYYFAENEGFKNINMDIIAGLPDEDIGLFNQTLEQISVFNPGSLTVHTLSIKRAANLKADAEKQGLLNPGPVGDMVGVAYDFALSLGMHPYYMYRQKNMLGNHENVAYCKPGFESPYNIHIMEEDQTILAVGAGAVSKVVFDNGRIERAFNMKSVEDYIRRKDEAVARKTELFD